jgi:hypothetical protein
MEAKSQRELGVLDQIHNNHRYQFGHTLLCCLWLSYIARKAGAEHELSMS